MSENFFSVTKKNTTRLSQTERQLFDYVVKNIHFVKDMSIQKFAADRYLSTTTIFRFTQKLGFSGYADFIDSLLVTSYQLQETDIPGVMQKRDYSEEYLKNIIEAVRVMPQDKVTQVLEVLSRRPNIYIITDDHCNDIGRYCEKLFWGLGLHTYFPEARYQIRALLNQINNDDFLIALSYSGEEPELIETIEQIFLHHRPFLMSLTRADNNLIQTMSDANFYVFAEEVQLNNLNLTSRVSMLAILELLAYKSIT